MLERCDAGLLIGDPALMVDTGGLHAYDLAEVWRAKTGLPFVFAVWTVRKAALAEMRAGVELGGIFRRSRDHGLLPENLDAIAREWSPRMGLSRDESPVICARTSTTRWMRSARKGLALYFRLAAECGVIERVPELEFMEEGHAERDAESYALGG